MDFISGEIIGIDKPLGWTSFDAVKRLRGALQRRLNVRKFKVGHAGTLDPLATGVLVVCTGRATKRIDELQNGTKEYIAEIRLGATTPSFDLETEIDAIYPWEHINEDQVRGVLPAFTGVQVPDGSYVISYVESSKMPKNDDSQAGQIHQSALHAQSMAEEQAYYDALKRLYKFEILKKEFDYQPQRAMN